MSEYERTVSIPVDVHQAHCEMLGKLDSAKDYLDKSEKPEFDIFLMILGFDHTIPKRKEDIYYGRLSKEVAELANKKDTSSSVK